MITQGCDKTKHGTQSLRCRATGFTLIELLVVIAVIGLLMSVLLPSLQKAKEAGRKVVCLAHLRSVGTGLAAYTTNYDEWLPGPNTSGKHVPEQNGNPPTRVAETSVIQKCDWYSPLFGDSLGFSTDSQSRFIDICETEFKCPSNREKYFAEYDGSLQTEGSFITNKSIPDLLSVSYSSLIGFHLYSSSREGYGVVTDRDLSTSRVTVGSGYVPKFNKVGTPGSKVFVTEGTRYRNGTSGLSLNAFYYQDDGGNYMHSGPATNNSGDPFNLRNCNAPELTEDVEKYAYRHNKRINAAFFDGHSETMQFEDSLNISLYWPKGSTVKQAQYTYDTSDYNGKIIK